MQSNDGGFDSGLAFRIAKAFFPELTPKTPGAAAPFDPATYDVKKFDPFVGRYALDAEGDLCQHQCGWPGDPGLRV